MRTLLTADWQIGSGSDLGTGDFGAGSRFQDQSDILHRAVDLAIAEKVELFANLGDTFERSRPAPQEILLVQNLVRRLLEANIRCLFLQGNHDSRGSALPTALEIFAGDGCVVSMLPSLFAFDDLVVATLPWTPPGAIVAAMPDVSRDDVNDAAATGLLAGAKLLAERCKVEYPGVPSLLVGHWMISGALGGLDTKMVKEPVIPLDGLADTGFSVAMFGHVHAAGMLAGAPTPVGYTGSPQVNSWGETEGEHGVWIYDSGTGSLKFHPVADNKRFVTSEIDATVDLRPMAWDVENAVVRVVCSGTESEMRRFDIGALRKTLLDLGALKVVFRPRTVREERARSEQMAEDLTEVAALEVWLGNQQVEAGLADRLRVQHAAYVEAVR